MARPSAWDPTDGAGFAFLLFGEWLAPVQLLGGAMVIAGILIMQRHDARAAAERTARMTNA